MHACDQLHFDLQLTSGTDSLVSVAHWRVCVLMYFNRKSVLLCLGYRAAVWRDTAG